MPTLQPRFIWIGLNGREGTKDHRGAPVGINGVGAWINDDEIRTFSYNSANAPRQGDTADNNYLLRR